MAKKATPSTGIGWFGNLFGDITSQVASASERLAKSSGTKKTATTKTTPSKSKAAAPVKPAKGKSTSTSTASKKATHQTAASNTDKKAASKKAPEVVKSKSVTTAKTAKPSKTTTASSSKKTVARTAKKANTTPTEVGEQTVAVPPSALPIPESTTSSSPLESIKVIMDEQSELSLKILRNSLEELLMPLGKIDELFSKLEALQEEVQRLDTQLNSLRNDLDDGLEELKQSVHHKAANS